MAENFFEIQNGSFTASESNKVNNVNLSIKNKGEIVSYSAHQELEKQQF